MEEKEEEEGREDEGGLGEIVEEEMEAGREREKGRRCDRGGEEGVKSLVSSVLVIADVTTDGGDASVMLPCYICLDGWAG